MAKIIDITLLDKYDKLIKAWIKGKGYATTTEVKQWISEISTLTIEVVEELPAQGEPLTIYLVPNSKQSTNNIKDEYIWINDKWELIGSTQIDLSNYITKDDANKLKYKHPSHAEGTDSNVKAALDQIFDKLYFIPMTVSVTGGSDHEVGEVVTTVPLKWTLSKDPISQSFNQGIGEITPVSVRSKDLINQNIKTNITYTLTVKSYQEDGITIDTKIANTSIRFAYYIYAGKVNDDFFADKATIRTLPNQKTSDTFIMDVAGKKRTIIAIPNNKTLSKVTIIQSSEADITTDYKLSETITQVNDAGGTPANYKVYEAINQAPYPAGYQLRVTIK